MSKKLILILVMVFSFSVSHFARAEVVINEVMYNPIQNENYNEWIEIYNTDDEIDLTNLILCESASTNNKVKSGYIKKGTTTVSRDNGMILSAGQYAIITDGGSGTEVYDSYSVDNFALALHILGSEMCNNGLSNEGEIITLFGLSSSNSVTYSSSQGANGNGKSLQRQNDGSWISTTPTPGTVNHTSTTTPAPTTPVGTGALVNTNSDSDNSSTVTTETKTKTPEVLKIKTQITSKTLGFVGFPLSFQATAFGYSGEQLHFGKYFWNFGDGDSKEAKLTDGQSFTHTYFYPSDYVVSLDYYQNYYSDTPDASNQITIKIIPADISISGVGDEKDFFVELTNNTDYNADISNWIIASAIKSFIIPRNTILASKKKIIISPKITNFSIADKNTLKLMTPEREIAFDYASSIVPAKAAAVQLSRIPLDKNTTNSAIAESLVENLPVSPDLGGLASVVSSDVAKNDGTGSLYATIIFIISFVFIGAAAGAVYFIRQKKIIPQAGSDFEILDE